METLEWLTDAEIDEADQSAGIFAEIQSMTAPLDQFLSLIHAFKWLDCRKPLDKAAFKSFLAGAFGDPHRHCGRFGSGRRRDGRIWALCSPF